MDQSTTYLHILTYFYDYIDFVSRVVMYMYSKFQTNEKKIRSPA